MVDWKNKLIKALELQLPGVNAQKRMAPYHGRLEIQIPEDAHLAAVLILLYEKSGEVFFPLITRVHNKEKDQHRGQVSLPGGRKDKSDPSLEQTAIRECSEEIGVSANAIELLGKLSPLYIPVSNHYVFPFIATCATTPYYKIQLEEVEEVHEFPVSALNNRNLRSHLAIRTTDGIQRHVPAFSWGELVIWGATAMILEEFAEVYASSYKN
ncbi:MAG: CoA pyrophosphatase [Saprospiraceae bacterium]|nr:CoA pyrophosphatase [Saprospiraceae bacterium]